MGRNSFFIFVCVFILAVCGFFIARQPSYENHEGWNRIYLATYPRSGNHWMRYLIEEATGVMTGSVYLDPDIPHQKTPYSWGGYAPLGGYEGDKREPTIVEPVVIKTHYPVHKKLAFMSGGSSKSIRIVRNPYDSIHSYFIYGKHSQEKWPQFFKDQVVKWQEFQEYWDQQPNVVTFCYEDIMLNPEDHLAMILDELGYNSLEEETVRKVVQKYPPKGVEGKHKGYFSEEEQRYLEERLGEQMKKYGYL